MDTLFKADGRATLIGSLPVSDHHDALQLIFKYTGEVPLWPQLPSNPREGMLSQFVEGIPGIIEETNRTYFNILTDSFEGEQLAFYEQYLAAMESPEALMDSPFRVSRTRARGLYDLYEAAAGRAEIVALKGQITGPFTMLTGIKDKEQRTSYYDPTIREMTVKAISLKAGWQVLFLKGLGLPVLLFIDEPALAGLGSSAFISISREDIGQDLEEVISAVQQAGGLAGIHVCANTDWDFVLSTTIDILSFDAYAFFDRLIVCREQLYRFLERNGIIAWGIVPTSEPEYIEKESVESLVARWEAQADQLVNDTWDRGRLLRQTLITPSCGTGSLSLELATKVLELTSGVSRELRRKYG
jgi:methionine synthase II (cobalamin-independent)